MVGADDVEVRVVVGCIVICAGAFGCCVVCRVGGVDDVINEVAACFFAFICGCVAGDDVAVDGCVGGGVGCYAGVAVDVDVEGVIAGVAVYGCVGVLWVDVGTYGVFGVVVSDDVRLCVGVCCFVVGCVMFGSSVVAFVVAGGCVVWVV